jgi:hypothetical protein
MNLDHITDLVNQIIDKYMEPNTRFNGNWTIPSSETGMGIDVKLHIQCDNVKKQISVTSRDGNRHTTDLSWTAPHRSNGNCLCLCYLMAWVGASEHFWKKEEFVSKMLSEIKNIMFMLDPDELLFVTSTATYKAKRLIIAEPADDR